jgi:homocysteine S-methyltransferase
MSMTKKEFLKRIASGKPLLSDGAMGTLLHARGIRLDGCFDALNLSKPELVAGLHREYLSAGAEIIQTNTLARTASN